MANGLASQKSLFYVLEPLSVLAPANESTVVLLVSQSEARVSPSGDAPRILRPRPRSDLMRRPDHELGVTGDGRFLN